MQWAGMQQQHEWLLLRKREELAFSRYLHVSHTNNIVVFLGHNIFHTHCFVSVLQPLPFSFILLSLTRAHLLYNQLAFSKGISHLVPIES